LRVRELALRRLPRPWMRFPAPGPCRVV
jgi:hypothetical protein